MCGGGGCRRGEGGSARRRVALVLATTVLATSSAACYTTTPLLGPPTPGTEVAATLNDRGRLALGDSLGTNVDVVEGRVTARTDSSMVLAVQRVRVFSGDETRWTGEPVTLRLSSLRTLEARRPAPVRTLAVVLGASAVVLALILTRTLSGGGSGGGDSPPISPPAGS